MRKSAPVIVVTFYRFVSFSAEELDTLRLRLLALGRSMDLKGTLLLAQEGLNGTISGPPQGVAALLAALREDPRLADLEVRESGAHGQVFHRLRVRIKPEIVTMGRTEVVPAKGVGTYVPPTAWDALIGDPNTLVIDTRNGYEVAVGSFEGAIDPGCSNFQEFPHWVERCLKPLVAERRPKALALFCTGGIRCEKATAFLLEQGFEGVHHLQGGVLRYLEEVPQERSLWKGECFVFDQRVAVTHRLERGEHRLCHACRMPLSPADRALPSYVEGVCCLHCASLRKESDRARFAERQRQQVLAAARGESHVGRVFPSIP